MHCCRCPATSATDATAIAAAVATLRAALPELADDPHLLIADRRAVDARGARRPAAAGRGRSSTRCSAPATGLDLVGIYAGGPVCRGFANSLGQRNWHEATSFNLQWSLYHRADKAVKSALSGFAWDARGVRRARWRRRADALALIAQPPKSLAPGEYRAYLAPAAMEEIVGLLCWGGFSGRALATRQSAAVADAGARRRRGSTRASSIAEAIADGVAPGVPGRGLRPSGARAADRRGAARRLAGLAAHRARVRARRERRQRRRGAGVARDGRRRRSPRADALAALGTGLCVGNLWYLNYSDRPACRMTGMTRFATFWVEDGRIVAPVDVLRFDDTIYRMLGENLEALTARPSCCSRPGPTASGSWRSMRLPGALLSELAFTL